VIKKYRVAEPVVQKTTMNNDSSMMPAASSNQKSFRKEGKRDGKGKAFDKKIEKKNQ
jgi:hypothetical protein